MDLLRDVGIFTNLFCSLGRISCEVRSALVGTKWAIREIQLEVILMRKTGSVLLVVVWATLAFAQHAAHSPAPKPATLMTGLSEHHHPVSTKNLRPTSFSTRACA